jgi:nitroreductase
VSDDSSALPHKPATTRAPIHDLLAARWSPRAFDPERDVTREQITALVEAARWAPSCFGDEPWRFLVWHRTTDEAGSAVRAAPE